MSSEYTKEREQIDKQMNRLRDGVLNVKRYKRTRKIQKSCVEMEKRENATMLYKSQKTN